MGIFYRKREEESSFADEVLSSKPMGQVIITCAMMDDCWRGYDLSYRGMMQAFLSFWKNFRLRRKIDKEL